MVGAGVLAYLLIADRVGALGGGVLESVRGLFASAWARSVLQWIESAMHAHDAMSIALVFVGVASLHVSGVRGHRWRIVMFVCWFGIGEMAVGAVAEQWMLASAAPSSVWGMLRGGLLDGAIGFGVGAALFPSSSVRIAWGAWWLCGVASNWMPDLFGMLNSALEGLRDVLGVITMAFMLIWAVRARRSIVVAGSCRECRYDLSGTAEGAPCPECGGTGTRAV